MSLWPSPWPAEDGDALASRTRLATRLAHEDVLVLDVETGVERGRASAGAAATAR
jgi:hypothetical protein